MTTDTDLAFDITLPESEIGIGDKIVMNMSLSNLDKRAVYVNCRFAVVPKSGDVWLDIHRNGDTIPFRYRVRLAELKNSDFLLLEPTERVVAGCHLSRWYRLDRPGSYQIQALYVSSKVPGALKREHVFTGEVRSPPAHMIIR